MSDANGNQGGGWRAFWIRVHDAYSGFFGPAPVHGRAVKRQFEQVIAPWRAVICVNDGCGAISDATGDRCPACGMAGLVNMERVMLRLLAQGHRCAYTSDRMSVAGGEATLYCECDNTLSVTTSGQHYKETTAA
jgi:hypothetical protein